MKILVYTAASPEYAPLAAITDAGKSDYCARHGYEFASTIMDAEKYPHKHLGFGKVAEVLNLIEHPQADWIFWTGSDVQITNPDLRLESIIDYAPRDTEFIIANDSVMWGADSFLIKRGEDTRIYLKAVLGCRGMVLRYGLAEQEIMWNLRGMIKAHEVPQRILNAYFYELRADLAGYTPDHSQRVKARVDLLGNDGQWQPGDFLIHLTPCNLAKKIELATLMAESMPDYRFDALQRIAEALQR